MIYRWRCCSVLWFALASSALIHADDDLYPGIGTPLEQAQLGNLPQHVFPDGSGLVSGQGTVQAGEPLYKDHCAQCHGSNGQGGRALELVGDRTLLDSKFPDRGIAVYWPNAPTLYEYVYRSMPPENPASFSSDEMYSLLAYLLFLNDLIAADVVVNAKVLSNIRMPNRDGFRTIGH